MAGRAFDGLILDFAGVLTTNMVEVISEFERREGLPAGTFLRMWADLADRSCTDAWKLARSTSGTGTRASEAG